MYGKIIKEYREEKKLTQKELANLLNTTQSCIGKYEREELDLNTSLIIKICNIFNITPNELLGYDYNNVKYSINFRDNNGTINNNFK